MSRLIVTNVETQNIKFDSDTTAFTIGSDGVVTGTGNNFAMVKLLGATISSPVAKYHINDTYITSTYDHYMIQAEFLPATDNVYLYSQVYVSGSAVTGTDYGYETAAMSSSAYDNQDDNSNLCKYAHSQCGNATGEGITLNAHLQNVNSTTRPTVISGFANVLNTTADHNAATFTGSMSVGNAGSVVNGIDFWFNSGNIAIGTVKLYGFK